MRCLPSVLALTGLLGFVGALPTEQVKRDVPSVGLPWPRPDKRNSPPLEERTLISVTYGEGTVNGLTIGSVDSFRSIPFAQPPVGDLRLRPPQRINGSLGDIDGTNLLGPSCPQMVFSSSNTNILSSILSTIVDLPILQAAINEQEDCLTITVQRPSGTTADSNLPVLYWIFGGGFEIGSNVLYDGSGLVSRGIALNEPFIFVGVNYRLAGFGFLGGKEILADGAANLGLLDQRLGLEWVADNIAAFGGDPDRVTIWGESAGAISVFDQMALYGGDITYNGKDLFRGAIMNSGSITPVDPVDGTKAQAIYDTVVESAGCTNAEGGSLACLRGLSYADFQRAANSVPSLLSYNGLALSYLPRPDGTALPLSPDVLVRNGQYKAVPMIIGDQEDEGTLFSIIPANVTNTDRIVQYLSSLFFQSATTEQIRTIVDTYPDRASSGSPFRTSIFNQLRPNFKRLAAILGDLVFTLTRRAFLNITNSLHPDVPSWSYLSSYDYGTPILGTFHGTDLLQVFYGLLPNYASKATQTYYINFVNNLNPNFGSNSSLMEWPQWSESKQLMNFFSLSASLISDDFRSESYDAMVANIDSLRV